MNEPQSTPPLVNWLGYLAITLLLVLPLSVLTVRAGAWQQGLLLFALACLGSTLLLVIMVVIRLLPRYQPHRVGLALRALVAVPGTALMVSILSGSGDYPRIHDITTDTADPPLFTAAPAQRGKDSNPLDIDPATIAAQQQAYPQITTLVSPEPIEASFQRALATARELGWEVYREDLNAGYIEAVDTTALMGFKDDVVIRLRTNADGTLVDLRSVSRVGLGDLGANAARIERFTAGFQQ